MIVKTVGERIRYLRTKKHMTQGELAKILCVKQGTVSSWERDRTEPNANLIVELSKCFGVSIQYLLTGKSDQL